MTNSKETHPKCFSAVLRRLLCTGSLPTHPEFTNSPTDPPHILQKTDPSKVLHPPPSTTTTTTTPAGVVARLMGIDSFPCSPHNTRRTALGTILRSKSVNSVDFLPPFELTKQTHHQHYHNSSTSDHHYHHRRVRTSVSFRELPTFLQTPQNQDVFLVRFDKVDELGRQEMGSISKEEKFKKPDQKNKKYEYERERNVNMRKIKNKKSQSQSQSSKGNKRKNTKKKKGDEDDEFPLVAGGQRKYTSRSQKYDHPLPKMVKKPESRECDGRNFKKLKKKPPAALEIRRQRERDCCMYSDEYCVKVLMEVCRLTGEETKGCVWMDRKVFSNFQEISYELGHEILEVLLYEVVDELCCSS